MVSIVKTRLRSCLRRKLPNSWVEILPLNNLSEDVLEEDLF